jgi:hypothetical protein
MMVAIWLLMTLGALCLVHHAAYWVAQRRGAYCSEALTKTAPEARTYFT